MVITVFVVALTIGVAGSWLVMADSAFGFMSDQIKADNWDLRADFAGPTPTTSIDPDYLGLNQSDVEYIIPFTILGGEASYRGEKYSSTVLGCDEMNRVRDLELRDGKLDFNQAVVTNKLADDLGLEPGDRIKINFGTQELDLEVSAIVFDIFLYTIYTVRSNIATVFPVTQCSGVYIKLIDPGQGEDIATNMRALPNISKVVVHDDILTTIDGIMEMAITFLYTFFWFNLMITIVVAGSAVIISTMERDVEFATLETLGIPKRRVAKSILIEMGLLGTASAAIGVPFAYIFGQAMALLLEDVIFYFPVVLVLGASITIFIIGLASVLISSVIPIRYANKLDTEKTIRERTAG
jgi:ABC-type lipoprotein release transport system permease subunit